MTLNQRPVGVFDSGVGGLSVLRELRVILPGEDFVYVADQAHVPYGSRPIEQIREFSVAIADFLLGRGAKLIVVACNTASAAALQHLRVWFPKTQFVGMEPAVKPAAEKTRSGKVGVLATPATFRGELYASIVERFAADVLVMESDCPGLVQRIEAGDLDSAATRRILEDALRPMLADGVDTIVLGCTHYPFVLPLIRTIVGETVQIIEPSPAVARQAARLLQASGLKSNATGGGELELLTSGDDAQLRALLPRLLGETWDVAAARWTDAGGLQAAPATHARRGGRLSRN